MKKRNLVVNTLSILSLSAALAVAGCGRDKKAPGSIQVLGQALIAVSALDQIQGNASANQAERARRYCVAAGHKKATVSFTEEARDGVIAFSIQGEDRNYSLLTQVYPVEHGGSEPLYPRYFTEISCRDGDNVTIYNPSNGIEDDILDTRSVEEYEFAANTSSPLLAVTPYEALNDGIEEMQYQRGLSYCNFYGGYDGTMISLLNYKTGDGNGDVEVTTLSPNESSYLNETVSISRGDQSPEDGGAVGVFETLYCSKNID